MTQITLDYVLEQISLHGLSRGVLSSPRNKQAANVAKVSIRPLEIKGQQMYQMSQQVGSKILHSNITCIECCEAIQKGLNENFKQGMLCCNGYEYHILVSKKKQMTVLNKKTSRNIMECSAHNRTKSYILPEGIAVPFLVHLGIMTQEGEVVAKKYDKFRQINRFLEMVRDILPFLPLGRSIEAVDFGCGKAYLTFALYHYLHFIEKREVRMTGVDLKEDVIAQCRQVAANMGYDQLSFVVGDVHGYELTGKVDLMVALHACDTATDAALAKGVRWGADVILCAPCCQHELYGQIKSPSLDSMLRHGILKERFAALATDAARAELLTISGYEVQILEFIDMEHTPKNLLIRAVKNHNITSQNAAERYQRFKAALSISPALERILR